MVESTPGRGTSFQVFFHAAEPHRRAPSPLAGQSRGAILVVDDEASVREFIAAVLRKRGYGVLTASDGREALAILEKEKVALVAAVLDIVMPVMGANDMLPELKVRQPDLKVLLTSGYSETEARRLCAAYPDAAFIQKPYTAREIARAVEDVIGAPS
jgi:CheY-like chemotaxis protein